MILFLLLFVTTFSEASSSDWVGIYEGRKTENVIAIDTCTKKGCNINFLSGPFPIRIYADCPKVYRFTFLNNVLSFNYKDHDDERRAVRLKKNSRGEFNLSNFSYYRPFLENPSCTLADDVYEEVYKSSADPELETLLPICKNLNDHQWIKLCRSDEHRAFLKFYLKESKIKQEDFLKSIAKEEEDLSVYLASKILDLFKKDIPKSKVLKEIPFQGNYETQKLLLHQGLSNWHHSLVFNDCRGNACEYHFTHCEGMSYGVEDCRSTFGKAIFESEDKIFIKDICEDQRIKLKKVDGKWNATSEGCYNFPMTEAREIKTTIYEASYNCLQTKLSQTERIICRSEVLSTYDKWLNEIYNKWKNKSGQAQWIKERDNCIKKDVEICLINSYEARIAKILQLTRSAP